MGPRPPRAPAAPAPRPSRPVVVERRDLAGADRRPRLKPKPDAAAQLRDVADVMQHLPRACLSDPAELVMLMRRLAGRLVRIADTGLDSVPSHRVRAPRQPFMARPPADAQAIAAAVFGPAAQVARSNQATTITSRKGKRVRIEIRRARAAGQIELAI